MSQENPEAASNALERVLALHALEIERSLLLHLFAHHEIPEWILRRMIAKIESQIERIEDGKTQIKEAYEHKLRPDRIHRLMSCIVSLFEVKRDADEEKYIKARTRMIILEKVLARFEIFYHIPEVADSAAFRDIMALYTGLLARAKNTREELYAQKKIQQLEQRIVQDMLSARKDEIIERLVVGGLISPKTAHHLDGVLGWERG